MECTIIKKEKEKLVFILEGINAATANMIRRFAMDEVPSLAIKEVKFQKNGSALYDEMIAHRLGLIPLKTSSPYKMPEECSCEGKGCASCEAFFSINAKGPSIVTAEMLKPRDEGITILYPTMPIVKLLKNQELKVEAKASLGLGRDHVRHSPALIFYRPYPELIVEKDSDAKKAMESCTNIVQKSNKLEIKDITSWNESQEESLEAANIIVKPSQDRFIFTLESWGQWSPKQILTEAIKSFDSKLNEFEKAFKKL